MGEDWHCLIAGLYLLTICGKKNKIQEEIGKVLNKGRSTVPYYLQKYDEEYKYNTEFRELADWFNLIKEEV